jgi:putative metallohydrolase (TIGR04338 family)
MRDSQRAKVYAAEEFVRTMVDRAGERRTPVVEFFGTQLTLPPEARFSSIDSVQRYLDDVLGMVAVRQRWPAARRLTARTRRGAAAAHYENRDGDGVVAVPDPGAGAWALRELVILHEMAHHLCGADAGHGPQFVATVCDLAALVMGPELGHVLRVVYANEGVR